MSSPGLVKVIANEWILELKWIWEKGLNGYKWRKEAKSDSLVQSGHAEIEGTKWLFIFGNALEVLDKENFQKEVEDISFQYMKFDNIVQHSQMKRLWKFEKLEKLSFSDNNIHSFIQISKLEQIMTLKQISILNNDVSKCILCWCYIVYRFPSVLKIDGKWVLEPE